MACHESREEAHKALEILLGCVKTLREMSPSWSRIASGENFSMSRCRSIVQGFKGGEGIMTRDQLLHPRSRQQRIMCEYSVGNDSSRLAPKLLGDSTQLIEEYLLRQRHAAGGFVNRGRMPDLYYSVFAFIDALQCLQSKQPLDGFADYLSLLSHAVIP